MHRGGAWGRDLLCCVEPHNLTVVHMEPKGQKGQRTKRAQPSDVCVALQSSWATPHVTAHLVLAVQMGSLEGLSDLRATELCFLLGPTPFHSAGTRAQGIEGCDAWARARGAQGAPPGSSMVTRPWALGGLACSPGRLGQWPSARASPLRGLSGVPAAGFSSPARSPSGE